MLAKTKKAFTLLEILVVVILIAVIAGFAIPNYQKSVERSYLRSALMNLTALQSAEQIYRAQNGNFYPMSGTVDAAAINLNLGLNLIENGMTYTASGNGATFTGRGVRWGPAATFTVTVTQAALSAANPQCSAGSCP